MKDSYKVKTQFGNYDVQIKLGKYAENGNLAIDLFEPMEGPFARLTVNLSRKLPKNQAYVDVNNCRWAERFIEENNLGKDTGMFGWSGYCIYPLYEFNMEAIGK